MFLNTFPITLTIVLVDFLLRTKKQSFPKYIYDHLSDHPQNHGVLISNHVLHLSPSPNIVKIRLSNAFSVIDTKHSKTTFENSLYHIVFTLPFIQEKGFKWFDKWYL